MPRSEKDKHNGDVYSFNVDSGNLVQDVRGGPDVTVDSSLAQDVREGPDVTVDSSLAQDVRGGSDVTADSSLVQCVRGGPDVTVDSSLAQGVRGEQDDDEQIFGLVTPIKHPQVREIEQQLAAAEEENAAALQAQKLELEKQRGAEIEAIRQELDSEKTAALQARELALKEQKEKFEQQLAAAEAENAVLRVQIKPVPETASAGTQVEPISTEDAETQVEQVSTKYAGTQFPEKKELSREERKKQERENYSAAVKALTDCIDEKTDPKVRQAVDELKAEIGREYIRIKGKSGSHLFVQNLIDTLTDAAANLRGDRHTTTVCFKGRVGLVEGESSIDDKIVYAMITFIYVVLTAVTAVSIFGIFTGLTQRCLDETRESVNRVTPGRALSNSIWSLGVAIEGEREKPRSVSCPT